MKSGIARHLSSLYVLLLCAFLIAPIALVVVLSFGSGEFFVVPLPGVSLRWYEEVASSAKWREALANTLMIATVSTVAATVVGTLAAIALSRTQGASRSVVYAVVVSPMVVPVIVVAVSMYLQFAEYGLASSIWGVILGHAAICVPYVVITVAASLAAFNVNLTRAASSLGAPPLHVFRTITAPILSPAIVTGAIFAFATSFDEVVVTLFLSPPGRRTLPQQFVEGVREAITPAVTAAATLAILISLVLLLVFSVIKARNSTSPMN